MAVLKLEGGVKVSVGKIGSFYKPVFQTPNGMNGEVLDALKVKNKQLIDDFVKSEVEKGVTNENIIGKVRKSGKANPRFKK